MEAVSIKNTPNTDLQDKNTYAKDIQDRNIPDKYRQPDSEFTGRIVRNDKRGA